MTKGQKTTSPEKQNIEKISNFYVALQIVPQFLWLPGKC
jgi:hypothetical protein